ncbi:MAG: hypothetical protein GXZ04_07160 [Clostridiales bacterium]|nr:hypothetical protein [Clostridiales bacterium]
MQGTMEGIFDTFYLLTVITLGVLMVKRHRGNRQHLLFGIMAVTLGLGDAFHLVPRVNALLTTGLSDHVRALGTGKLITSLTMTVFYLLLYHVWQLRYHKQDKKGLTALVYALGLARVVLCLLPQNGWTSPKPSLAFGIYRNIPFAILGGLIIWLFWRNTRAGQDPAFRHMSLTILLSFGFYLPVVLLADRYPWVGILMIPKTLAYVWTVLIGYRDMVQQQKEQTI